MQAIKAIVIGMGFLIVAGMAILVYGLTNTFEPSKSSKGGDGSAAFGTIRATLPSGATVQGTDLDGDTMLVRLAMPDGGVQIMVFRLSDGRQIGTIDLQSQR